MRRRKTRVNPTRTHIHTGASKSESLADFDVPSILHERCDHPGVVLLTAPGHRPHQIKACPAGKPGPLLRAGGVRLQPSVKYAVRRTGRQN